MRSRCRGRRAREVPRPAAPSNEVLRKCAMRHVRIGISWSEKSCLCAHATRSFIVRGPMHAPQIARRASLARNGSDTWAGMPAAHLAELDAHPERLPRLEAWTALAAVTVRTYRVEDLADRPSSPD
jgi:hypothetical protein